MSSTAPTTQAEWLKNAPIGPVVTGPIGQQWAQATGSIVDTYVGYLKDGIKARMPDYAPVDALPHIGGDRQLIQGSSESNASFITRLKDAWGQWSRAGTACSVLEQLWYFGLTGATWVQQNGLSYTFGSSTLTPGQDPTGLLTVGTTTTLAATLTSSVAPYRTIPAGTPWFQLGTDGNTDLTNRFAIIIPSWPFAAIGFAYFNNSTSAVVTWPVPFGSSAYNVIFGAPTAPVVLTNDGTAQSSTTATILASGAWTGVVPVIGWVTGINPFNTFSSASLGQLQKIIATFKPNAICAGVYAITSGRMWDYPVNTTWDGYGGNWDSGPSTVSTILGAF